MKRSKDDNEKDFRVIAMDRRPLDIAGEQSDPILDNLPPFLGDRFDVKAKRVTFDDGTRRFLEIFPRGFHDPDYLGVSNSERRGWASATTSGRRTSVTSKPSEAGRPRGCWPLEP